MEQTNNGGEAAKRPVFLTVLCILSFIAAGFAILGYIAVIGLMGAASAVSGMASDMSAEMGSEMNDAMSAAMAATPGVGLTWAYIIVGFLTTIVGLFGVIKMWKLQKSGFMMYVGATVVSLIMGIVYSGFGASIVGIVISAGFIVMYFLNTKAMK